MILQIDRRMRPQIHDYGCYYLSLCFLANKYANAALSAEFINDGLYLALMRHGLMSDTCYIKDPVGVLHELGLRSQFVAKVEPPTHALKDDEFQVLRFKGPSISHFVVGTATSAVAYDPYGESRAVREGVLVGQRVFRRL